MTRASLIRSTLGAVAVLLLMSLSDQRVGAQTSGTTRGGAPTGRPAGASRRGPQTRQAGTQAITIAGTVVMHDGSGVPPTTIIERVCFGRVRKEARVDAAGAFAFRVGGSDLQVAETTDQVRPDPSGFGASPPSSLGLGSDPSQWAGVTGCELRASLAGYRSSVVYLKGGETVGQMNVGSIVLQPMSRLTGSTVSLTTLQAPKEARRAFERAEKELREGRAEKGEKYLKTAVALFPRFAEAWFDLGLIYEQQRRVGDARDMFSRALEADGKFVSPYVELARLAGTERKWEEVVDLTDRALALNSLDIPEAYYFNALANYSLQRIDAAELSARRAQRIDSQHKFPNSHLLLAEILKERQDAAGEAEQLRSFLQYAPSSPSAAAVRSRLDQLAGASAAIARREP